MDEQSDPDEPQDVAGDETRDAASVTTESAASIGPAQASVAEFVADNDLAADPEYRLLDLAAEVGELATDAVESTDYGESDAPVEVAADEVGDALFALLAFAESVDVDAGDALVTSLAKYDRRMAESGDPSSG